MTNEKLVIKAENCPGRARVALACTAALELAVNAGGFVALGDDHMKPPEIGDALGEFDVGSAPGHVCGDSDSSALPGFGDDLRLDFVVDGVENLMVEIDGFEVFGELIARAD